MENEKKKEEARVTLSKKKQVRDYVISCIVEGTYPPGTVLSEKSLGEELSLSKSPIREALIELCNENIIRSIPRFGYEVIRLTNEDVYDLRNLRLALECGFLSRYGKNVSAEKIQEMYRLLEEERSAEGSYVSVLKNWEDNENFHLTLFAAYRNPYAYRVLKDALNRQTRAFAQFYWDKWRQRQLVVTDGYHKKFLDALSRGDIDGAVELLEADIRDYNGLNI